MEKRVQMPRRLDATTTKTAKPRWHSESTMKIRKTLLDIIDTHFSEGQIRTDLAFLEPKERIDFFVKILPYVCAKPVETEFDGDDVNPNIVDQMKSTVIEMKGVLNKN